LLVEGGGSEAISGEEYRRRLSKALEASNDEKEILGLPFGAGSGFKSGRVATSGYVFCARIGEEEKPWFRFVSVDEETWKPLVDDDDVPKIASDTLTCLLAADPQVPRGGQDISDQALAQVFESWALAQRNIHDRWMHLTDRANLEPKIEKPLREAYALVLEHGEGLGLERQDVLLAKLNGRWDTGVVKHIRSIVRSDLSNKKKIAAIDAFVTEAGLPVPEQAQPLRPVRLEDIRVVCWMAVSKVTSYD